MTMPVIEEIFNRPVTWIALSLFIPIIWTALSWFVGEMAMQLRRPMRNVRRD